MAETTEQDSAGAVITVGTYDGVHLGHQYLIAEARREAARIDAPVVVVTFDRNPLEVIRPELAPKLLTDLELKLELLEATGIDEIVVLTFDQARAHQSAEEFIEHELVKELGARVILVGSNFRFGYQQKGDVALLGELGAELGFSSRGVDLVTDGGVQEVVSSSRIRDLVSTGDLEEARNLLGRPHEVRGAPLERGGKLFLEISPSLLLPPPGRYDALLVAPRHDGTGVSATVLSAGPGPAQLVEVSDISEQEVLPGSYSRLALRFGRGD